MGCLGTEVSPSVKKRKKGLVGGSNAFTKGKNRKQRIGEGVDNTHLSSWAKSKT